MKNNITNLAKPSLAQIRWMNDERMMFLCLDPCTWQGEEYDTHKVSLSEINPSQLDTDQWCQTALSWGAKTILFVAKHTGGFCWWQTDTTNYGIKETPYKDGKGDVLADLSKSCVFYGLNLAVYVYPGDYTFGAYNGGGGRTTDKSKQEEYSQIYRQQLTEVLTRYGEISEIWFDGSVFVPVSDILEKYAPNAIVFQGKEASIRWAGTEEGQIPYPTSSVINKETLQTGISTGRNSDLNGDTYAPIEVNTTLYDHYWFWAEEKMKKRKNLDDLMNCFYKSVGHGAVFLLNASPNTDGLIPEDDCVLYKRFGDEIKRRFSCPLASTCGNGYETLLELPALSEINHVVLEEDFSKGERIREFVIEGLRNGVWLPLYSGSLIGRKHIAVFETTTVDAIKVTISNSVMYPLLEKVSAYNMAGIDINELIAKLNDNILLFDSFTKEFSITDDCRKSENRYEFELNSLMLMAATYKFEILSDCKFELASFTVYMDGNECSEMITKEDDSCFIITRGAAITDTTSTKLCLTLSSPATLSGKAVLSLAV